MKADSEDGGPVQAALMKSFEQVEQWCLATWEEVADKVPGILEQHIPVGQLGMFLATLYQVMCTQQQGITSMVAAQAGVPVHLGISSWVTQASLTRLFAQILGSDH